MIKPVFASGLLLILLLGLGFFFINNRQSSIFPTLQKEIKQEDMLLITYGPENDETVGLQLQTLSEL